MHDGAFKSDIGDCGVRKVIQMADMLENSILFNQDMSGWKTESLVSITDIFRGATSFRQILAGGY